MTDTAAPYRGVDRRYSPSVPTAREDWRWYVLAALIATGAVAILTVTFLTAGDGEVATRQLQALLRTASVAAAFSTGMMAMLRWRITGEAPTAYVGLALIVLAAVSMPLTQLAPLLYASVEDSSLSPLSRAVSTVLAVPLLLFALKSPVVSTSVRPRRVVGFLALLLIATIAVVVAIVRYDGRMSISDSSLEALEILETLAWAGVAIAALLVHRRTSQVLSLWVSVVSTVIALSGLFYLVAIDDTERWLTTAIATKLVAFVIAGIGAWRDLASALSHQSTTMLRLLGELHEVRTQLDSEDALEEERRHELRSTLASVRMAVGTLDRHRHDLDEPTRAMLERAVVSELSRLENVLGDRDSTEITVQSHRLTEILEPLLVGARESGLTVETDLRGLAVHGKREDIATVFQNLLTNARKYAPGSPVTIRARRTAGEVVVWFEDRGPGIPPAEREQVLRRGSRGSTSRGVSGTGLGLHVASRLLAEQGGGLTVHERPGGGAAFRLTLPAPPARSRATAEKPAEDEEAAAPAEAAVAPAEPAKTAAGRRPAARRSAKPKNPVG